MAVMGINYRGCNHDYNEKDERIEVTNPKKRLKYKSVYIHTTGPRGGSKEYLFKSGNFVKDWYDAKKKYINELQEKEPYLMGSSCVNDFFMDGAKYDTAYLHMVDGQPVLKYIDRTKEGWYLSEDGDGWEFFVEEGTTPTWEELRELCGDPKKVTNGE